MKKVFSLSLALVLALVLVTGCSSQAVSSSSLAAPPSASKSAEQPQQARTLRIAGLKGPTTMGMVKLMDDTDNGANRQDYEVTMYGTADEIVPKLVSGEVDIAAIPANLASVLYNNTEGKIQVAAINTLGVLYIVENGNAINSVEDLRGKTIYAAGKGTVPEYVLTYILQKNGIDPETDVTIEFKSEATEVAALLGEDKEAIAMLPQPYVTAVQMQNAKVRTALDLTQEWNKVSEDGGLVTGVLVARSEFIEQDTEAFKTFLEDYKASIEYVTGNVPEAAALVAQYGIVEKAPVAEKALPACNITYIDGGEMKAMLGGYLQVLFGQEPKAVGGSLPDDAFYYMA